MFELLSIPAIIAAVEAIKMAGLPSKWASLVSIVLGGSFGIWMGEPVIGFVLGLSASGAYSGVKAMLK